MFVGKSILHPIPYPVTVHTLKKIIIKNFKQPWFEFHQVSQPGLLFVNMVFLALMS